ncbi:MAG: hypothetical protein ACI9IT_001891, partial [Glaciecola sp.]
LRRGRKCSSRQNKNKNRISLDGALIDVFTIYRNG